jgi:Ribbon-helix-helix protein, copG family
MYNDVMNRTQIYIDAHLQTALRKRALDEGRSVASLIREAVAAFLGPMKQKKPKADPFLALAGKFSGGPGDSATRHDEYAYARRKK